MKRSNDSRAVLEVLQSATGPMRAGEIARQLDLPRSRVNAVLYAGLDQQFSKDADNFTWRLRREKADRTEPKATDATVVATAHFAPNGKPISVLCGLIDDARSSILVQAYYLRSPKVAQALTRAKKRGVPVIRLLLGCTSTASSSTRKIEVRHGGRKHSIARGLHDAGVEVFEDWGDTNNHNKCMVIDGTTTVTGGMNFCDFAAENRDNIVVIRSPLIAEQFTRDWEANFRGAARFKEDVPPRRPTRRRRR